MDYHVTPNDIFLCIWHWCDAFTVGKCSLINTHFCDLVHARNYSKAFLPQVLICYAHKYATNDVNDWRIAISCLLLDGSTQILVVPCDTKLDIPRVPVIISSHQRQLALLNWRTKIGPCATLFYDDILGNYSHAKVFPLYNCALGIDFQSNGDDANFVSTECTIMQYDESTVIEPNYIDVISTQTVSAAFYRISDCVAGFSGLSKARVSMSDESNIFVVYSSYSYLTRLTKFVVYILHIRCVNNVWITKGYVPYSYIPANNESTRMSVQHLSYCCESASQPARTYIWVTQDSGLPKKIYLTCHELNSSAQSLGPALLQLECPVDEGTSAVQQNKITYIDADIALWYYSIPSLLQDDPYMFVFVALRRQHPQVDFIRSIVMPNGPPDGFNVWRRACDQAIMCACYYSTQRYLDIYNLSCSSQLAVRLKNFVQPLSPTELPRE